jgi:hypothetical protein
MASVYTALAYRLDVSGRIAMTDYLAVTTPTKKTKPMTKTAMFSEYCVG